MSQVYALFDTLLEPVFVINENGKSVYCNEAASLIAGHSVRKISRGLLFGDLFSFSEEITYLKNIANIRDPQPYKELQFTSAAGETGKAQITIQPSPLLTTETHWIIFFRDVTLEERLQKKYRAELEQKEDFIKALENANKQLEDYSKNLEFKVQERTKELSKLNKTLSALLDSLGQGFLFFAADGTVQDVVSKACLAILETNPTNKNIWDVLKLPENKVTGFKNWMHTIFEEMLPFEDLACLGPQTFPHSEGRSISLNYYPLRDEFDKISGIVIVATDITELVEAQNVAEREKEYAKMIIHLIKSKQQILRFSQETTQMLTRLEQESVKSQSDFSYDEVFRDLHTLKGGAALFSIKNLADNAHEAETILSELRFDWSKNTQDSLVQKIKTLQSDFINFKNQTEEVLGKSSLQQERSLEIPLSRILNLSQSFVDNKPTAPAAAEQVLHLAMRPASEVLDFYNDVLTQTATKLEKIVSPLNFKSDLQILPESYQNLFGTFVHLFRNAVDHGIETPEARITKGKPEAGTISIDFKLLGQYPDQKVQICISDDGNGISPDKIRSKMQEKGLTAANLSDEEVLQTIFNAHFSTNENVTDISGRGVGLDAVKESAEQMGGRVWVKSEKNKGTQFFIEVPYVTNIKISKIEQQAA